ncbi:hypothetical protein [Bacterioplanes sanyensis]|uniref:hypothetical protein n=1 Tax=Bacterioplanes sanyensis TaxID=1249553 RepID=UPI0012FE5BB7|nr:hypothetical protein [Bacterioplanes sanyensis]
MILNNWLPDVGRLGSGRWALLHLLPALLFSYGVTSVTLAMLTWLLAQWWSPAQPVVLGLVSSLLIYTVIFMWLISRPLPQLWLVLAALISALAGVYWWL